MRAANSGPGKWHRELPGIVNSPADYSSLQNFALRLLGNDPNGFIIPFEIVSVLLLMTLICAITVARRTKEDAEEEASK